MLISTVVHPTEGNHFYICIHLLSLSYDNVYDIDFDWDYVCDLLCAVSEMMVGWMHFIDSHVLCLVGTFF